ncbi:MAG: hypothetical protein ABS57_06640 [Mesorhizobium sp. SCN 65-12]|nr:MAG: hypothetical protein ABS57_06640 [Mesorhizobium sp. SCN 65-12]
MLLASLVLRKRLTDMLDRQPKIIQCRIFMIANCLIGNFGAFEACVCSPACSSKAACVLGRAAGDFLSLQIFNEVVVSSIDLIARFFSKKVGQS